MTDADRVDVRERPQKLVHVELDLEHRHWLLELGVVAARAVDGLRHVFEDKIEVNFVFLWHRISAHDSKRHKGHKLKILGAHLVAIRVEESPEVNDIRVTDESHDLQLTVLVSAKIARK